VQIIRTVFFPADFDVFLNLRFLPRQSGQRPQKLSAAVFFPKSEKRTVRMFLSPDAIMRKTDYPFFVRAETARGMIMESGFRCSFQSWRRRGWLLITCQYHV